MRFQQRVCLLAAAFLLAVTGICAEPTPLTLQQARNNALQHHPRITVAQLRALASREGVREARSGFFPSLTGNIVAVGTANAQHPIRGDRRTKQSEYIRTERRKALTLSQLITDFGRTANLVGFARLPRRCRGKQRSGRTRTSPVGSGCGLITRRWRLNPSRALLEA